MLTKEYRNHQNCLNLGLIPVYLWQPTKDDYLPNFYARNEGNALKRAQATYTQNTVGIYESSYENGLRWDGRVMHVECFVLEFGKVAA